MSILAGITGGIGSGKTVVCNIFARLGGAVFHADAVSRLLTDTHPDLREKLSETFGSDIYTQEGLNRKHFASVIFNDKEKLLLANSIIHPYVYEKFREWAEEHKDFPVLFMEAAILFETGAWKMFHKNILVTAPREVRIMRVMKRDGLSRQEILARMENQSPEEDLIPYADYVISNDGVKPLLPQVLTVWENLLILAEQIP